MTPEPRLRSRRGARSGPKKKRKNGSEKNGVAGPAGPRTVLADAMLTTAGIAALATRVQAAGRADRPSRRATDARYGRTGPPPEPAGRARGRADGVLEVPGADGLVRAVRDAQLAHADPQTARRHPRAQQPGQLRPHRVFEGPHVARPTRAVASL